MIKGIQTVSLKEMVDYLQNATLSEIIKLQNMKTEGKRYTDAQMRKVEIVRSLYHLANNALAKDNPNLFSSIQ